MARLSLTARGPAAAALLRSVRYEVIPTPTIEEKVVDSVPIDVTVTVTASPAKPIETTVELAERLAARGYRVVPHVSARLLKGRDHLTEVVERLRAAGIDDVFVPAGDADPPAGEYEGSLPVLIDLESLGAPFPRVGITGYPESHPAIDDDVTVQSMWDKRSHATYIVSNLCFDPATISDWVKRVRRRGVMLPIQMGLAGPVERAKLLTMATKVGVGQSTRFLTQHASFFTRLMSSGYSPENLLGKVAGTVGAGEAGIAGLHVFTFNQVAETERWRQDLLGRLPGG